MTNDVALTSALRSNLLSLQSTQAKMDKSQLILSTGRKINSALDGPQSFFAAKSLNDRASDLSSLLDGMGQSISTIQSADTAVSALTKLIEQGEALATQARDAITTAAGQATAYGSKDVSGVTDVDSLAGIVSGTSDQFKVYTNTVSTGDLTIGTDDDINTLIGKISNSQKLIGGGDVTTPTGNAAKESISVGLNSAGQLELAAAEEGEFLRLEDGAQALGLGGFESLGLGSVVAAEGDGTAATSQRVGGTVVAGNTLTSNVATSGTQASDTLDAAGFTSNFAAAGADAVTFNLTVDGKVGTGVSITATTTVQDLVDGINNDALLEGKVTASFDQDAGTIGITTDGNVSNVVISNTVTAEDSTATHVVDFGFGAGRSDGDAASSQLDAANEFASESIFFSGGTADVTQLQTDYNELRSQIDSLVEDASYRGTNLLQGDNLTTAFNEDRSNTLVTQGVTFTASGLGISEANFANASSVDTSLGELRGAKNEARNFGESIANDLALIQTREDFTKSTVNTLQSGADKLTLADQNEESAKMLALQTRQQIGFISLSMASQSQQGILRLF